MPILFLPFFIITFIVKGIERFTHRHRRGDPLTFDKGKVATLPRCPFDLPGQNINWRAAAKADISSRGGHWYIRQFMECGNCGSRARMGRFMYENWDFVTSVVG